MLREIPPLGARVYVDRQRRGYVVRARDENFAVCTKPHFKTVLYFILDAPRGLRGTEDRIFGMGAETDEQCWGMLARLAAGDSKVSRRNCVEWDVERVKLPNKPTLAERRAAHGFPEQSAEKRRSVLASTLDDVMEGKVS